MIIKPAILLVLIASAVSASAADRVDRYIGDFLASRHIPGAAVLVTRNGRILKNSGYGFANLETGTRVTSETVFEIGSMTKQFTAAGVMLLVEEGRLRLDDPIANFFSGAPAEWRTITIRHLLGHTSGIQNHVAVPGFMDQFKTSVTGRTWPERDDLMSSFFQLPFEFAPGESWAYDNTGYILLGMIIEQASGKSYWEFLDERIFKPAGMNRTRATNPKATIKNRASGYGWIGDRWENRPVLSPHVAFSAGSLVSTVGDVARWDAALRSGKILKKESLAMMRTPGRLNDGSVAPFDYGFGWFIDRISGRLRIQHDGGTPGFSSIMQQYPEDGLTVIILANHADTVLETAASEIAEAYEPKLRIRRPEPKSPASDHAAVFRKLLDGAIERERFTPAMTLLLRSATGKSLFGWYASLGEFSGFRLIGRERDGNLNAFRYSAVFSGNVYRFTFKTDESGRIAQILYW